jgi:GNAT superfamily N-acetyltransferase
VTIRIVAAGEAPFEDLQTILGTRGEAWLCQCQRYKLGPGEAFRNFPVEERARRLREQTRAEPSSGLIAYLDGEPAGWCAVQPRPAFTGLVRVFKVPWEGRDEDRTDASVWAVTCLFTRAGFRRRGVSRALARAAVDYAREHGARALEGYPMRADRPVPEAMHVGTEGVFADAGLSVVTRPGKRRAVMRIDF